MYFAVITTILEYFLNVVFVQIKLHYCLMYFEMRLMDADDGWVGKHNMLKILLHESSPLNDPHGFNRVSYSLPVNADLRFQRFWSFSFSQSMKGK